MQRPSAQPWVDVPPGELHSWGVDYIRVTAESEAGKKAILLGWAKKRAQLERLGDKVKKDGLQGFTGESCGPVFYGRNDTHFMLQASGAAADELFPELPWVELHCTRIDLQVTMQYTEDHATLGQWLGQQRAKGYERNSRPVKPRQGLHVGYGRGDTLSIGSRSSPRYGRIYDKQRESKDERYSHCWRFEIEYKDPVADNIVEFLRHSPSMDRAVAGAVAGQLQEWGIALAVPTEPVLVAGSIGRREYDSDRAIKWLETQVRPTVERLLATVDEETIWQALGLPDPRPHTKSQQTRNAEALWEEGRRSLYGVAADTDEHTRTW